jgi:hypothetical protein
VGVWLAVLLKAQVAVLDGDMLYRVGVLGVVAVVVAVPDCPADVVRRVALFGALWAVVRVDVLRRPRAQVDIGAVRADDVLVSPRGTVR